MANAPIAGDLSDLTVRCIRAMRNATSKIATLSRIYPQKGVFFRLGKEVARLSDVLEQTKQQIITGSLSSTESKTIATILPRCLAQLGSLAILFDTLLESGNTSEWGSVSKAEENSRQARCLEEGYDFLSSNTRLLSNNLTTCEPSAKASKSSPQSKPNFLSSGSNIRHFAAHSVSGSAKNDDNTISGNGARVQSLSETLPRPVDLLEELPSNRSAEKSSMENLKVRKPKPTPLFAAAKRGQATIVKLLLEQGADVNDGGYHDLRSAWSPLCTAAKYGHEPIVKVLLDHGANIHAADHTGWTAIGAASKAGYVGIVHLLLEKGANVSVRNESDWTPLHTAALYNRAEVIKVLLNWGADVQVKDDQGRTPLLVAINAGHEDIVRLLLAYQPTEPPPSYERSILAQENHSHGKGISSSRS
jgi:Ankyrin repeats (3 copies)/Ankyrin repeat